MQKKKKYCTVQISQLLLKLKLDKEFQVQLAVQIWNVLNGLSHWNNKRKSKQDLLFYEKWLFKLFCICLFLEKLIYEKHFLIKEKFSLVFKKVFSFYFEWKTLFRVVKNLKMLCNLLILSNLVLKLLIAIYFVLNLVFSFQFYPLKFDLIWFIYQLWSLFL